jgi:hypothetical protein
MSDKPSYLGLLNAIAVGESQAHAYLSAWIDSTSNADVKATLSTVAAREGEHGMSFAKRVNELGYTVRLPEDNTDFEKRLAIAGSKSRSDLEKMEKLGFGRLDSTGKPDIFDDMFTDHSIDIATGALLGRYIAEERDSGRILKCCYDQLKAAGSSSPPAAASDDRLASVEAKLDAICAAIGDLQATSNAKANGKVNGSANGRATRAKAKR